MVTKFDMLTDDEIMQAQNRLSDDLTSLGVKVSEEDINWLGRSVLASALGYSEVGSK